MNTKPPPQASTIPELGRDIKTVKATMEAKYDMYVSDQFAADHIAYVMQMDAYVSELERRLRELIRG